MAIWERVAPNAYHALSPKVLPILAAVIVLGGFGAISWRNISLARTQAEYNRTSTSWMELVQTLNQVDGDYIVLTSDEYLSPLLPAYVKQRFVLPIFTDPMTNDELTLVQNAAAHLLGYADWKAWVKNSRTGTSNAQASDLRWELDPKRVLVVVNRNRPDRNPPNFAKTLLTNQDFVVGIAAQ